MKIEKVNDRQIRITLTKKELEQRDLKLTEIAYGNEKVKALFKDMMAAASIQYGFEADDIPLMIEVIPFPDYCTVVITKVEDPEELDTRFSRFSPSVQSQDGPIATLTEMLSDIDKNDELSELFKKLQSSGTKENKPDEQIEAKAPKKKAETNDIQAENKEEDIKGELTVYFEFNSLNDLILAARQLAHFEKGKSNLYKNTKKNKYLLEINDEGIGKREFLKECNILSEYGDNLREIGKNTKFFVKEHFEMMILEDALEKMGCI